jgi:cytochrome b6-f complex iron-sulfur subunit
MASRRNRRSERLASRRTLLKRLGWGGIAAFFGGSAIASIRFFYPRVLFEPPTRITVGLPAEYPLGSVSAQYKAKHGIWIVRREDGRFTCIRAICTHLGCTPNWLGAQGQFKCPCHGSGFYLNGENYEGPAPRPLDRYKLAIDADGRLVVDKGVVFRGVANADSDEIYPDSLLEA